MSRILVTGAAGFIGFQLTKYLANEHQVVGIDSLACAYGEELTRDRLDWLGTGQTGVEMSDVDLARGPQAKISDLIDQADVVIHLAAWAGVRSSMNQWPQYFRNNIAATEAVLEGCAQANTPLLLASSSSVYGDRGATTPCRETAADGSGLRSPYAVSKWMGELWVRAVAERLPSVVMLRPFSIYGPWGRPDMAYFAFGRRILRGEPIPVFGDVQTRRDFTYIDDAIFYLSSIVEMMLADDARLTSELPVISGVPTVNICNGDPHSLLDVISGLEQSLGRSATIDFQPASELDLRGTHGDPTRLHQLCGIRKTPLVDGLDAFADWMNTFQGLSRDW